MCGGMKNKETQSGGTVFLLAFYFLFRKVSLIIRGEQGPCIFFANHGMVLRPKVKDTRDLLGLRRLHVVRLCIVEKY